MGFLCFCKETLGKKAASRDRACGPGPLRIPLGFFGLLAFEAKRLHTLANTKTPRLPNGGAYVFATFLPSIGTGARVSLGCSLVHRPMGLRTEVILWEAFELKANPFPQDHLCRIGSQTQFVTQCLVNSSVPKPQKQKPPCRATSTGSGG